MILVNVEGDFPTKKKAETIQYYFVNFREDGNFIIQKAAELLTLPPRQLQKFLYDADAFLYNHQ